MEKNSFLRGVSFTIAYYLVAAFIAYLSYHFTGQSYVHAPGVHHIILFLSWLGGAFWTLFSLFKRFQGKNVAYYRGTAMTNLLVLASAFVWFYRMGQPVGESREAVAPADELTTEFSGDTAIVRHRGSIVFLRIGDSIYFDELSRFYKPDSLVEKKDSF